MAAPSAPGDPDDPSPNTAAPSRFRARRSSGEVRAAVLAAAVEEFSTNGYNATTVQGIARTARLGVSAVYNHFDSKRDLFKEAVLEPFLGFLDEFSETWHAQRDKPWDDLRLMSALIAHLYDNLRNHRKALVEVAAEHGQLDAEIRESLREASTRMFNRIRLMGEEEATRRASLRAEEVDMAIRLTVAMVTSVAVYADLLVPASPAEPTREELIAHMARYALWGIAREPRPT